MPMTARSRSCQSQSGLSVLDFLSFVVSFYLTEQQLFEWEDPT